MTFILTLVASSLGGGAAVGVLAGILESPATAIVVKLLKIAGSKEYTEEENKIARRFCLEEQSTMEYIQRRNW